jgi:hypothetical protein
MKIFKEKHMVRIVAVLVLAGLAATVGLNIGPTPEEVQAFTQTETYKAQERAHFERMARLNVE